VIEIRAIQTQGAFGFDHANPRRVLQGGIALNTRTISAGYEDFEFRGSYHGTNI
jgi:hypothetical protein